MVRGPKATAITSRGCGAVDRNGAGDLAFVDFPVNRKRILDNFLATENRLEEGASWI